MQATIWQHRIDILGGGSLPKEKWEPLLDELGVEHVLFLRRLESAWLPS
jgi:hypothetical protein